ncbi:MAG: hypothetical protein ACKPKO_59025, partial [Candidatus Fonsibacter sp.]
LHNVNKDVTKTGGINEQAIQKDFRNAELLDKYPMPPDLVEWMERPEGHPTQGTKQILNATILERSKEDNVIPLTCKECGMALRPLHPLSQVWWHWILIQELRIAEVFMYCLLVDVTSLCNVFIDVVQVEVLKRFKYRAFIGRRTPSTALQCNIRCRTPGSALRGHIRCRTPGKTPSSALHGHIRCRTPGKTPSIEAIAIRRYCI